MRFNLMRAQDTTISSMSSELVNVQDVEVVNESTVRPRLKSPDASLILAFPTALAFHLVGDGIRDAFDPRQSREG